MPADNWWGDLPYATASSARSSTGAGSPAGALSPGQNVSELREASAQAATARDALAEIASTRKAVKEYDPGPWKEAVVETFTPRNDATGWEAIPDTIGAVLGAIPATLGIGALSSKSLQARQHLQTASARATMAGANTLKGPASDKDTALAQMANISPAKYAQENYRILDMMEREAGLSQARAKLKSAWVGRYGSIGAASPNGMSFERALGIAEDHFRGHHNKPVSRRLPAPPPQVRARGRNAVVTIDLDGNPIR